ncbi:hypothetical protein [Lonepinella sp. BR2919]|uniref:hypothetical protein n=1 Tax=unclassified Lonepinella TaxID=2642006 RepID=UPI003F6E34BD
MSTESGKLFINSVFGELSKQIRSINKISAQLVPNIPNIKIDSPILELSKNIGEVHLQYAKSLEKLFTPYLADLMRFSSVVEQYHQPINTFLVSEKLKQSLVTFEYIRNHQQEIEEYFSQTINDENRQDNKLSKEKILSILNTIIRFFEIISLICTLTGAEPNQLFGLSPDKFEQVIYSLCDDLPSVQQISEVREVYLAKGRLMLRKYDRKNAEILMELDNGTRFCVLNTPKQNQQWLRIAVKNDNGQTIIGYVYRRFTKKLYI